MNDFSDRPPSLLVSGIECPVPNWAGVDVFRACSASETLRLVRMFEFDLLLAGLEHQDVEPWALLASVRHEHRGQKWAMFSSAISDAQEVRARALGAVGVFDALPPTRVLLELITALRRRASVRPGGVALACRVT